METASRYRAAPFWVLRMTGFPVEQIRELASPALAEAVDRALLAESSLATAAAILHGELPERRARIDVEKRRRLASVPAAAAAAGENYHEALARAEAADAALEPLFALELARIRGALYAQVADEEFHALLLHSTPGLEALTPHTPEAVPPRNHQARRRELTWVSYLQRVTTKNETISVFGPSLWGRVDPEAPAAVTIELDPPAIARRTAYLERWPCVELLRRMAEDPEVAPLFPPRVADELSLVQGTLWKPAGEALPLSREALALFERLVGGASAPAAADEPALAELIAAGAVTRTPELPLSPEPLAVLERLVASWPPGGARTRWQERLAELARLAKEWTERTSVADRRGLLDALGAALTAAGAPSARGSQALYQSRIPINEDCERAAKVAVVGRPLLEQLTIDLAPWYELWRDLAGAFAGRMLDRLVPVFREAAAHGPVRLPAFLRAAQAAGVPLSEGGVGAAGALDQELQRAWQEELGERLQAPEVTLTEHDLGFVRRRFRVHRLRAFGFPAPDIQILARDREALASGRWQALLAEVHPHYSLWVHGLFAWCPDAVAFSEALRAAARPTLEYAKSGLYDGAVHAYPRAPEHLGGWTFTGPLRADGQPAIRSAEVTVALEDDELVCRAPDGRFLGSLVDNWLVAINTHRLELVGTGDHSPRLKLGRIIAQRRAWRVSPDEELRARLREPGLSALRALRRLRARLELPEEIFVRPLLPLRGTHHKDAKPMFVDFKSPLLLELLAAVLARYRQVWVTEMRPTTEECWLADSTGHYSCELRFAMVPEAH